MDVQVGEAEAQNGTSQAGRADGYVEAMRRFSRFYTRKIGLLQEEFLGTDFSLTEGRVLYELAHRRESTAAAVGAAGAEKDDAAGVAQFTTVWASFGDAGEAKGVEEDSRLPVEQESTSTS